MLGLERFLQSNDYPASEIILTATYLLIRPASFTCWLLLACPFPLLSIFLHFPIDFLFADFTDGIVQVNAPVLVRPAVLTGQLRPAQDKGVQYLRFIGQGCECGGFKKEIGQPGKADRFFRLMDINGVCHIVFVDG